MDDRWWCCVVVIMMLQVMARDLGYTELETVGEGERRDHMGNFRNQHKMK